MNSRCLTWRGSWLTWRVRSRYRGIELDALLDLNQKELVKLFPARCVPISSLCSLLVQLSSKAEGTLSSKLVQLLALFLSPLRSDQFAGISLLPVPMLTDLYRTQHANFIVMQPE